jgi:malate synthase
MIKSIVAVIDEAGLKKLSKWIKPIGNNLTGINLNLKLGEQQKGGTVTKPTSPVSSIISSSYSSVESFIADLEKAGVSMDYADERLQIDASRLMETPTGSAVLPNIIEDMKAYILTNKDEILKYLQS